MFGNAFPSAGFFKRCALALASAALLIAGVRMEAGRAPLHEFTEEQRPIKSLLASATFPSTSPANPMPADFAVLEKRSIFLRRRVVAVEKGLASGVGSGAEAGMALRGVVRIEAQFIAFLEETVSHKTLQIRVGDSVCQGRIKSITLNSLDYETSDALVRVEVGQNLQGMLLPPATRPASNATAPAAADVAPAVAAPEGAGPQPNPGPPPGVAWKTFGPGGAMQPAGQ